LFFFYLKKKIVGHVIYWHVAISPRTLEQVAIWPRVRDTRGGLWPHGFQTRCQIATCINSCGHVGTCNKNTCPNGRINSLHASMLPRVIKTRVHKSTSCTLPRCRYDTWLGGHMTTVTGIVATPRILTFFVVTVSSKFHKHCTCTT